MADGKIVIETGLDTKNIIKDIDKFKNSLGNIDVSRLTSQMNGLNSILNDTGRNLETQRTKLNELRTAYNNSTNVGQRNQMRDQIRITETEITNLESTFNDLGSTINSINSNVNLGGAIREISDLAGEFRSADVRITEHIEDITSHTDEIADHTSDTARRVSQDLNSAGSSVKKYGEQITEAGEKAKDSGEALETGLTKPVLAAGAALLAIGVTTDEALSKIQGQLGTTAEETAKLKKVALDVYQNGYGESLESVGEGLVSLQQNLKSTKNMTDETKESLLTNALGMQSLFEVDPKELTSALSVIQNSGFDDDVEHAMDVLTYGFQNGANYSDELLDTMKEYAPQFVKMGISSEEAMSMLVAGANNGAFKLDSIGDAVKEFSIRAIDGSKTTIEGFQAIGLNAEEMAQKFGKGGETADSAFRQVLVGLASIKDPVTQNTAGVNLMGTMWEDLGKSSVLALSDAKKNIDGINGTTDRAVKSNTSAANQFETALRQTRVALLPLATEVLTMAKDILPELTEGIKEVSTFLSGMDSETKQTVIKMAMLAAGIGPVVGAIGKVTLLGGKFITFLGGFGASAAEAGGGVGGFVTALTGIGPVGWAALAAVTALGVGIAGAVTYNDLMSKSVATSTEDLSTWQKIINDCTGNVIKSKKELQDAGLVYKDFGEGVSDSFKKGVEEATKTYHDFEMALTGANSDEKISDENKTKITNSINSMVNAAKSAINSRKGEIQNELSTMFKAGDGSIDADEQKVIDAASGEMDEKVKKIEEIQGKISDVWTKAIQEHGKLSKEDVEQIEKYLQQVQQIKAEVEAKNAAESNYAKNEYSERLSGISAEDASSVYKDASEELKKKFEKERATYKTGMDELQREIKQYNEEGKNEEAKNAQAQLDAKDKEYKASIQKEQDYLKQYREMLYKKNSTLEGTMNEVDGSMFSKNDLKQKSNLETMEKQYDAIAKATEDGMVRVKDSAGKWHDIEVTVDQATGHITSAYDTFTGDYAGYSEKFADNAENSGRKVIDAMDLLQKSLMFNGGGVKLDENNNAINATTNQLISNLDTVIEKANGTKVALADINGVQVKLEFNKDGTLTNYQDIMDAINGKTKDNPAVVDVDIKNEEALEKFKETEDKIDELNGQTPEVTPEANTSDADAKLDETQEKSDNLDGQNPEVAPQADTEQANSNLETTSSKVDELDSKEANPEINVDSNNSQSILDSILGDWTHLLNSDNVVTKSINIFRNLFGGDVGNNYTGTNGGEEGLSFVNEHGWELSKGSNISMWGSDIAMLGSGSKIDSHMTSVNEMRQEVSGQVGNTMGAVIKGLAAILSGQSKQLSDVAKNTLDIVNNDKTYSQDNIQLTEKLASNLIDKMNSNTGTFSGIQQQLDSAKLDVDKASNMKAEDSQAYIDAKAEQDRINDMTSDAKKELGEEELKRQKDNADKALDIAKKTADLDIIIAKNAADQKQKIAEENKNKLVKIAEATTNAIKAKLEEEKVAAENVSKAKIESLQKEYDAQVASIDKATARKTKAIDEEIAALEEQTKAESRDDERKSAKDNINVLTTKMNNTSSVADKRALALQIQNAKSELADKEDAWDIEDEKAKLEEEKALISEKAEVKKAALKEDYEEEKEQEEEKLKATEEYYSKLLETDSLNAQARYIMLTGSNDELVILLNSYAPGWQNAGQTLADSLLTGINSNKQSVRDAVTDMVALRSGSSSNSESISGYATGTSYNNNAGLYTVDEKGWELSNSNNPVAYVSKGAAIKNHMQSVADMQKEVSRQVGLMRSSVMSEQVKMAELLSNNISNITNSNSVNNTTNNNGALLHVEHFHNENKADIEQIAQELYVYGLKQRRC